MMTHAEQLVWRELAERATKGARRTEEAGYWDGELYDVVIGEPDDETYLRVHVSSDSRANEKEEAEFIAYSSPDRVMALIDALAAARYDAKVAREEKALADDEYRVTRAEVARLRSLLCEFRDNWDCDEDSHRYGTPCRVCEASAALAEIEKLKDEELSAGSCLCGIELATGRCGVCRLEDERDEARATVEWQARRLDALQAQQRVMRDPERKMVCDILANGKTYEAAAQQDEADVAALKAEVAVAMLRADKVAQRGEEYRQHGLQAEATAARLRETLEQVRECSSLDTHYRSIIDAALAAEEA